MRNLAECFVFCISTICLNMHSDICYLIINLNLVASSTLNIQLTTVLPLDLDLEVV